MSRRLSLSAGSADPALALFPGSGAKPTSTSTMGSRRQTLAEICNLLLKCFNKIADFSSDMLLKLMRLERCKSAQLL